MMRYLAMLLSILGLTACQSESFPTLKVAATAVPHAEILEAVKPSLKKQNIELEVIVVDDYHTPNRALADKEVEANFFQHVPFLELQKKEFDYPLEVLTAVHIEPMGVYSTRIKKIEELKTGDTFALPSDPSNQARALFLLESFELIKLKNHESQASVYDISENPKQLKFIEVDSPVLARSLEDVTAAAITTNFALQAGLKPATDAILIENKDSPYANVLVIRKGDKEREELQALKRALTSEKLKLFLEEKYRGAIAPAF